MTILDRILKSRNITLPTKVHIVKDIFPQFLKFFPTSIFHILTNHSPQHRNEFAVSFNTVTRDLPSGPVVKTFPSNAGNVCWFPGHGTKILHASGSKISSNKTETIL